MEYNVGMGPVKKHRIKMRLKIRNRVFRNTGLALSALAAAAIVAGCCFSAARLAVPLFNGRVFFFTLKSVSVHGPSGEISAEISRRLNAKAGGAFSSAEAALFASALKKSYPALSRVEVSRNFLNGRVSVKAEAENVVAKVRINGGETFYLAENGRLLRTYCGPEPVDVFETDVYAGPDDSLGAFAFFLKELKAGMPAFFSRPVRLEYSVPGAPASPSKRPPAQAAARADRGGRYCRLTLENSALILWGELDYTKAKISRLNEVLRDSARRINGPLKVDFRYFRDGKVFVSKLTDI